MRTNSERDHYSLLIGGVFGRIDTNRPRTTAFLPNELTTGEGFGSGNQRASTNPFTQPWRSVAVPNTASTASNQPSQLESMFQTLPTFPHQLMENRNPLEDFDPTGLLSSPMTLWMDPYSENIPLFSIRDPDIPRVTR